MFPRPILVILALVLVSGAWAAEKKKAKSKAKAASPKAVTVITPEPTPTEPPGNRLTLEKFEGIETVADLESHHWKGGQEKDGKRCHSIQKENGLTFLRESYLVGTEALYVYKEIEWDVNEYPYLTW